MTEEKVEHTQGKPWKVESSSKTYEEALQKKLNFQTNNPDTPVKIKFSRSQKVFVVKFRNNEETAEKKQKNKKS